MHRELKQKQQQIGREKLMSAPKMKGRMGLLFSFIIAAYTYGVTAQTTVCENATVADIVFLIDGSSSITSFREVRYFLRSIIRALDIGPNKVRIGLAQFSGTPYRKFLLKDHVDKRSLLAAVDRFSQRGGGTEVGKAPDFLITEFFTKEAGSRADQQVPQIAVVITDGESSDDVVAPAQRLRMHGVIVFAIGVGQANQKNLQAIANWPPKQFLLTTDNYRTLQRLADSLLKTVCISVVGQKRALADRFADIFFLVDSGIGQGQFSIFRPELIKLIDQLNIGASAYRIGLAQYGEDVRVEFLLNEFQSKQETRSSVQNFNLSPEPDEPHNLGSALQYASTNLFISEAGGRAEQGSRQFLVVVSGKDSDDPVFEAARMIEAAGITVLGMNAGATMDAIYRFARYSFDSPRVTLLKDIFMAEKKDNVTEDCRGANVADIVFIVDESGRIGSQNFEPVYDFLHSIVSSLNVSANRVRIGIVTYNEMATAQAYLNTFSSKAGILQYISILPYIDILPNSKGIRNTGAALYFTEKEIFSVATGSRKGVQRVAVVITDGDSQDDVSEAAASLRRANVTIYAVGITDVKEAELVKIASHPPSRHVFTANSFTNLIPLKQELPKILCTDIISGVISVSISKTDTKEACTQKEEADVFFLMDDSGSINNTDFTDMKDFITEFLHNFHIGPNHVRMGLVKYSKSASLEFDLTTYSDAKALEEAVKNIIHEGGGTRTGDALSFMASKFGKTPRTHGYKVPEYLIVITDGESEDDVRDPAKKLREQGVIIYAVGVKNSNRKELLSMAGDPKKTFLVNNFDALKSINNDIATDICASDACKDVPLDIVFLVDSSGSISEQGYQTMKDFMKSVISKPVIGQKDVHIGVMQFSTTQKLEFSLTRYYRKDEMSDAIDAMTQLKENTLTGSAITEVSQYFDATRGGRPDVKKRLVIITDGEAQDKVERPAEALREKGVVIYAIGVQQAKRSQLLKLSGSSERVFYERDFDTLDKLEGQLVLKLCETECKRTERADIIFLVDGSGSIGSRFTSMQTFMQSVVNRTTVGRTHTQFGLILYSDDPESMFTLKTYDFKQDVLNAIMNIKAPGDRTYTGKALKFSLQYFNAEHGGRKELKVPQILMVITDGDATDHENLPAPSEALRNNGISVFSIGVENANKTELEIMAGGDKSRVFFVDNFDALETLYKNISSALCNSTKPVCDQADVVFLLDHSSSINIDNYAIMVNFTADLVQSLDVREKFVHVGLAQFSGDPKDEFYLNQYSKREDVVKRIHELEYRGGNTNIGEALRHVKKYFEVSQGSRKSANIPQNLVLISDGDSHDEVEDRGNQLRALGIEVFAIGVGDVHDLQLLQITGTAERLFSVQNFKDLATIKKKVLDSMCKPEPPINVTSCSIDIAMGFDISLRAPGGTLVSGHTKLQTFLPEIAHYVSSIPHLCCAGTAPVKTNITYQVVNRDGASLYQTEFKAYSADEVNTVMSLQMSEPTAFNTNLLNAFKETFQTKSTADVKVLLIFSDGLDEDVMKLEQQAELLQKSGVSALLIVALEGARNPAQLQMVEFGRGFSYHLPLSIGMQSVSSTILKQIDVVSHRVCCKVMCKCSGHEGVRGSPGKPGPKGLPGQKGHSGFVGDEGVMGERGRPGPSGPQGLRGCPGASGLKGSRGTSGDTGENGEDGLDGIDGEQGTTGLDGAAGEKGHLGNQGIPGIRGEAGLKGQRGLRGDPGEPGTDNTAPGAKGDPGNPGLPGQPGTDGRSGEGGVSGYPGPDGRRGSAGGKGTPGQPGALGLRGRPGAPGPQGPGGDKGDPGPKGISGFPGPQGEHGPPGDPGAAGRRGSNGQKGQPGDPGVKGAPGPQGPRGMPGEDGRDGYGTKGSKGAKGDPGFPGYPGQLGEDGVSGTKGYPGRKGNYGRSGNSGRPGASGVPGDPGRPGHRGPRGPPGSRDTSDCQLVDLIRNNCACSPAETECPAYPTELVFGLDMSQDVPPSLFERQRTALLSLLEDITVAESNCPTGARVAVVGFSAYTKYLIRFQDYRQKKQLIELVKNIAQERTSNRRQLGAAMRFVGQNVFKRVRAGVRIRKVAVFFSCGPSQDSTNIVTSIMEYQALNIIPAIISAQSNAEISRAVEVDDSRRSIFTVMGRDMAAPLRRVKNCAICYDPCRRAEECAFIQEPVQPQDVNVDLVMVVDSSREMQADEYAGAQHLLGSVVEQLAVSSQPRRADNRARVAVVQQSGTRAPKVEFSLQTYQNHNRMKTHLIQNMQQQGGSSALGQTLDFTLREVLLKASQPRRRRALLAVVGTQTAYQDRARLTYISKKVKCEGVAMFVVTVGDRYNRTQVEELAGLPVQQHLIHVSRLQAEEQGYAQRFFRVFLSALNKGVNTYPPPTFKQTCSRLEDREEALTLVNGQGSAEPEDELEEFQAQTGRKTQAIKLEVTDTLTGGHDQRPLSAANPNDACSLRQDPGSCQNYTLMWFFDSSQGKCLQFWYSGCGGNGNRFETQRECEDLCVM